MELPNRPVQHIIDTKGVALFNYLLPDSYIFRQINERDYGIDGLIEIAFGGQASGILLSVQLKSSQGFQWNTNNTVSIRISRSTCNYWLNGLLPTFLFIADLSLNCVFYVNVKEQIQERYDELMEKEQFIFYVPNNNKLEHIDGVDSERIKIDNAYYLDIHRSEMLLFYNVVRAINIEAFILELQEFVCNWRIYFEHISHCYADPSLVQPISFYNKTEHVCLVINQFNDLFLTREKRIDLKMIKEQCLEAYRFWDTACDDEILEYEISVIHSQVAELIPSFISNVKQLFLTKEIKYWESKNPRLISCLMEINWDEYKLF